MQNPKKEISVCNISHKNKHIYSIMIDLGTGRKVVRGGASLELQIWKYPRPAHIEC